MSNYFFFNCQMLKISLFNKYVYAYKYFGS